MHFQRKTICTSCPEEHFCFNSGKQHVALFSGKSSLKEYQIRKMPKQEICKIK